MVEASKVQVDNPANRPMHYGDHLTGRLYPPDYIPKYRLYSYYEGQRIYSQMSNDLYENSKKAKPKDKKGVPLIIKIMAGIGIVGATIAALFKFKK